MEIKNKLSWLVWLSGLSTGLGTRGSPVQFPVREFPVMCLGCMSGSQLGAPMRQPHINDSLPLFLPPFPSL